jgi:hypothetical protein
MAVVVSLGVGGVVQVLEGGLSTLKVTITLPLSFSSLLFLLSPLNKGHWCLFLALYKVNLHPHYWHCHCGWPSVASLATFQCFYLNT